MTPLVATTGGGSVRAFGRGFIPAAVAALSPTIDTSSNAGTTALYGNTGGSWSHTCTGTNNDGLLVVHLALYASTPFSMSYGGYAMTQVAATGSGNYNSYLYKLINPPTGANNITVGFNGTGYASAGAISFTNAKNVVGTIASSSGTSAKSASINITPTTVGSAIVVGVITSGDEGTPSTASAGITQFYNNRTDNINLHAAGTYPVSASTNTLLSWSFAATTGNWSMTAAEILYATGQSVTGQQAYTTAGTYSFKVPVGVTSVSIVCVGGGGAGDTYPDGAGVGGSLSYANNVSTTPGETLTVAVGPGGGGSGATGGDSSVKRSGTALTLAKGGSSSTANVGDVSYVGGDAGYSTGGGGGGAGGYSGNGGAGSGQQTAGNAGNGGSGGGGGGAKYGQVSGPNPAVFRLGSGGGGGGVGILGQGTNGTGGAAATIAGQAGGQGGGGSGGTSGSGAPNAGTYGGGGGAGGYYVTVSHYGPTSTTTTTTLYGGGRGGGGAVRIIWGTGRSFPSSSTGDI